MNCGATPDVDFIVAFFHHCAYATSRSHASDGGVRAALAPLFDQFGVDLVVQGHNHQYERTNPIRRGTSTVQAPDGATVEPGKSGTTYICCGSGGRPRYGWQHGEADRYRGSTTPNAPVTSFVAGKDDTKTPETVEWSQDPLPRLRLPHRARHPGSRRPDHDDERPRCHRRGHRDRPRRPHPHRGPGRAARHSAHHPDRHAVVVADASADGAVRAGERGGVTGGPIRSRE